MVFCLQELGGKSSVLKIEDYNETLILCKPTLPLATKKDNGMVKSDFDEN